jgi:hypothetical protein
MRPKLFPDLPLSHPYPPIALELVLAVEDAVRSAWRAAKQTRRGQEGIDAGDEERITAELQEQLARLWRSEACAGFGPAFFCAPARGGKVRSFDDRSVNRAPDLSFQVPRQIPVTETTQDGLFVECKVIAHGGRNTGEYCRDGLKKFIDGSYAWAMPQAMMIAYVMTSQKLPRALQDYFAQGNAEENRRKFKLKGKPTLCRPTSQPPVASTRHDRKPLTREGKSLGDIEVRHLWLGIGAK